MDSEDKAFALIMLIAGASCAIIIYLVLVADMKRAEVAGRALEYKAQVASETARVCAAYFDWSLIAKDRVSSFERHCAEAFDFRFKD